MSNRNLNKRQFTKGVIPRPTAAHEFRQHINAEHGEFHTDGYSLADLRKFHNHELHHPEVMKEHGVVHTHGKAAPKPATINIKAATKQMLRKK